MYSEKKDVLTKSIKDVFTKVSEGGYGRSFILKSTIKNSTLSLILNNVFCEQYRYSAEGIWYICKLAE